MTGRFMTRCTLAAALLAGCGDSGSSDEGDGSSDAGGPLPTEMLPCDVPADCPDGRCIKPTPDAAGICAHECAGSDVVDPFADPAEEFAVCAGPCDIGAEMFNCVEGWGCSQSSGHPAECYCAPYSEESCDGRDNDCSGIVDDPAKTDPPCVAELGPGFGCGGGECVPCVDRCGDTCTIRSEDPNNCGECGLVCPAGSAGVGACIDGACVDAEQILVAGDEFKLYVDHLASADGQLYWAFGNGSDPIERCDPADCAATRTPMLTGYHIIDDLLVDGDDLYYTADGDLHRCPLSGCVDQDTVIDTTDFVYRVAGDAGTLFLAAEYTVQRCDRADCAATATPFYDGSDNSQYIVALALDDGALYLGHGYDSSVSLRRCPRDGCASPESPSSYDVWGLAAIPGGAAWSGGDDLHYRGAAASGDTRLGQLFDGGIRNTALDAARMYVSGYHEDTALVGHCPLTGCPTTGPVILVRPQGSIETIHVDSTHIYWVARLEYEGSPSILYRVRKPA